MVKVLKSDKGYYVQLLKRLEASWKEDLSANSQEWRRMYDQKRKENSLSPQGDSDRYMFKLLQSRYPQHFLDLEELDAKSEKDLQRLSKATNAARLSLSQGDPTLRIGSPRKRSRQEVSSDTTTEGSKDNNTKTKKEDGNATISALVDALPEDTAKAIVKIMLKNFIK